MARSAGRKPDFFISYASEDRAWAQWLAWTLEEHGWSVELDVWDWSPGEDFVGRMKSALDNADKVLAVMTDRYFQGPHAQAEWKAAFSRNARGAGRLVPVVVDDCTVPDLYTTVIRIKLVGLDEAAAKDELVSQLRGGRPSSPPPYPPSRSVADPAVRTEKPAFPPTVTDPPLPPPPPPPPPGLWTRLAGWFAADRRRPLVAGTVLAGAAGTAIVVALLGRSDPAAAAVCPQPTELRVLASADILETARAATDAYQRETVDGAGCPRLHFYVYATSASRAAVAAAVKAYWRPDGTIVPSVDVGPRPDLWFADSTAEIEPLNGAKSAIADRISIGRSPIVLASFGDPVALRPDPRFSDELTRLVAEDRPLIRADPERSTTGAVATLAGPKELPAAERRRIDQQARLSLDRLREPPTASTATLLCDRRRAGGTEFAVVASKHLVDRYASGMPLSPECAAAVPARLTPQAVTPTDGYVLNYPLARFKWTTGAAADGARGLARWLTDGGGREVLAREQLEPADDQAGRPVPTAAQLDKVRASYRSAQRSAQVLLLADKSGSMSQPVAGAASRLQVEVAGFRRSLDLTGGQDRFGLWQFPAADRTSNHDELVPFGPGSFSRRQAAEKKLQQFAPGGPTPLYGAVSDGVRAMAVRTGNRSLVVLTDGEDTVGGPTPEQIRRSAAQAGVQVFVVAVGEARCDAGGPLDTISTQCLETDFDSVDRTLTQLFDTLWKGQ